MSMTIPKPNEKWLMSKDAIKAYLGNISDRTFTLYVKDPANPLPALYENGRGWTAHADNLDEWWRKRTRVSMARVIDQIPEE